MKNYFINKTSKIQQTFEDEFKAEYNFPECLWDNLLETELFEFVGFIRNNYFPAPHNWIRKSDGKIVSSSQIMEDYGSRSL